MQNLKNKKILLLGATGKIGTQIAKVLDSLHVRLILSAKDEQKLIKLNQSLKNSHTIMPFDITNIELIKDFLSTCTQDEKLHGLIHCACLIPLRPIKSSSFEFMQHIMLINYFSLIEFVRHFSHKNICEGGSIVAFSSYASINGDKGQLAYSASKGAIDSSVIVLAKELFKKNIRINAIRPAIVYENENINLQKFSLAEQQIYHDMKTGFIEPQSLAKMVAFLLSELSSGVTGRCFDVRGYMS